ncbi:N-glycosylase/DNA lyase [Candidatus Woesearchaeota archaeon]|nr:N-glycosylase/DNA lyase [Candidatus Woesearchaeota archaeon]
MKKLLLSIQELKKSQIKNIVNKRLKEFSKIRSKNELFKELCFCILTANSNAERCIYVQNKIGNGFLTLPKEKLQKMLKEHGARFHTKRAGYIVEARKHKNELKDKERDWLVKNIKGIGYKEASHFLRNTGYKNAAIIDFHIIDLLAKNNLIKRPKTLAKNDYLEIEDKLNLIAKKANLNLAELDLYLWYMETGKVLK